METDIKRINFFDGLFLRQGEFLAEQLYHLHMRRRLNYILFDGNGVVQVDPGDLQIVPTGAKNLHVTTGMAISRRDDLREGREIILRNNSPTLDLSASFAAGDLAFVAIHYAENQIEPQTLAVPNTPTKVEETATVTLHRTWPPSAPAPGGENYILLGQVDFNSMAVNTTLRQTAKLRASLIGGGVVSPPGAPTIATVTPATGARSSSVLVRITGTNFSGAVVTCSDPDVAVSGTAATAATLDFTLTIGAAANNCTITVTTATAPPATIPFTVTPAVVTPAITLLSPAQQASNATVDVRGTNIRNPALAVNAVATGTAMRFVGPGGSKIVLPANITVRPDIGPNQVVRFTVPDRTGTTWAPKQIVSLELTFGGPTPAIAAFQYDD